MNNKTKGIFSIVVSAFGFSLMALLVRLCDDCGGPVSAFQKGFFRNFVAFAIAAAVWWRGRRRAGRTLDGRRETIEDGRRETRDVLCLKSKVLLLLRSLLGTAGIFAHFYAL